MDDVFAPKSFRDHRIFVCVAAVVAIVALVANDRLIPLDTPLFGLFQNAVDAGVYRAGGDAVLRSVPLYGGDLIDDLPFTYPPFAALLFVPLALVSTMTAKLVFWVGNLLLLYVAVRLCLRHLRYANDRWTSGVSASLAVGFTWLEPVRMTVWFGQINLLLMVVVLWDLTRPQGSRLRGLASGLAAGTKLTPGLFIVDLAATKQWRAASLAAVATAATVVAGFALMPGNAVDYWFRAVGESNRLGQPSSGANQSVRGALPRWLGEVNPPFAVWLVCVAVVGVTGMTVAVFAHRRGRPLLGLTVCGLTAPMVSPFSWGHHWVWFVPLIVLTLDAALRHRSAMRWLAPGALCLPTLSWFHTYPDGVVALGTFMLPTSSTVVGVLAQSAYPLTFVAVLVGASVAVRHVSRPETAGTMPVRDVTSVTSRTDNGMVPTRVTAPAMPPSCKKPGTRISARKSLRDTHSYVSVTLGDRST